MPHERFDLAHSPPPKIHTPVEFICARTCGTFENRGITFWSTRDDARGTVWASRMPTIGLTYQLAATRVGRRVAEVRTELNLTQQDLGALTRTSKQWISAVENGGVNLTLRSLVKLANALQVTLLELTLPPKTQKARRGRPRARKT